MIQLATDKIVASGHSFGGITAVRAGQADGRVKAVVAFDPWLFVYSSEITTGTFNYDKPLFSTMTENFPKMCEGYD